MGTELVLGAKVTELRHASDGSLAGLTLLVEFGNGETRTLVIDAPAVSLATAMAAQCEVRLELVAG